MEKEKIFVNQNQYFERIKNKWYKVLASIKNFPKKYLMLQS